MKRINTKMEHFTNSFLVHEESKSENDERKIEIFILLFFND